MNLYTSEKLVLDRHHRMVAEGERLTRLMGSTPQRSLRVWTAACLRQLAERIDKTPVPARKSITLFRVE